MGKAPLNTGQTTNTERTSSCPAEAQYKIKHREPSTVGTLRSRTTRLEKNQAGVDLSLVISPRLCGKEAQRLELASPRREARLLLLPTIHPPATMLASMLTTSLHPSRGINCICTLD